MKAISLFSSAGIGELRLPKDKFEFILANELLERRAKCYSFWYPDTRMINGDITNVKVKEEIIRTANGSDAKLLLATPPCQGLSTLGKNKVQDDYINDRRNFLILEVLDIIDACNFDYILIENVPKFIEMYFPFEGVMESLYPGAIFFLGIIHRVRNGTFTLRCMFHGQYQSVNFRFGFMPFDA